PFVKGIHPNLLTVLWVALELLGICFLARREFLRASLFLLTAILVDCLDGDVARLRNRPSHTGALLENFGHWLTTPLAAVALALAMTWNLPVSMLLTFVIACACSTVTLLVATTYIERFSGEISRSAHSRTMHRGVMLVYRLMPLEALICATVLILPVRLYSLLPFLS